MSNANCNKCKAPILWMEIDDQWRPFDYGKKPATVDSPKFSSEGSIITKGTGFVSHWDTCAKRMRDKREKMMATAQQRREKAKSQ